MALLEVRNLTTRIRLRKGEVRAVDGVSLSLEPGSTLGIVGESGSGKTMLGMSILGLLPHGGYIKEGEILFDGVNLATLSPKEQREFRGGKIGIVFQDPMTSLNPCMTVGDQIIDEVRLHLGYSKDKAIERAIEVLALVGMPNPKERLEYYPHQLSGGLRQRVMIAIALACDPKLVILDEPTTALDVTIQAQILELLDDLKAKLGMAMMLITHDMGVIAGRADDVIVMYAGQIVEHAEARELFAETYHPYTEALLASIPPLSGEQPERLYSIPGIPPDLTRELIGCRFAPRCRYAQERCREEAPPYAQPEGYRHPFACFYPVGAPERVAITLRRRRDDEVKASGEVLVELDHVSKEYPVTRGAVVQRKIGSLKAVTDVSLTVYAGETLGLVGESGCGKSTTGQLVVGLERPTAGDVRFAGRSIVTDRAYLRQVRKDLQLMFQDPYASLDPRMRVKEIIEEPLDIHGIGTKQERTRMVARLLQEVGLSPAAMERYPHEFSGGQRQRIGLARALALSPKLIVADEPVSALDVSIRSQVLNLMRDIQRQHQLTYIVISHDLSVVRYLADRIGVMYLGKLVEIGTTDDIFESAHHPYTHMLLEAVPEPDPAIEQAKERSRIRGELPSAITPPPGCRFHTRCAYAQDICRSVEPPMQDFGGYHRAACHFPLTVRPREAVGASQG